ncbi:proto-oncogene tyrosine-protein kinase ROS [Osmerus eperlanus]|uniref:proto-oncogene tyrosine-protein kinase ROS n=1 Tax=Osmerus eperlanus TaxID=29151 RepID=UPI002E147377
MDVKRMKGLLSRTTRDLISVSVFVCMCVNAVIQKPSQHFQTSVPGTGVQADIHRQNNSVPSVPLSLVVESLSGESIEVTWSPPEEPAGIIIGYNLNLTDQSRTISSTVGANEFSASFFPTIANTTYRIAVAAVNRKGQGPAATGNFTTPPREEPSGGYWVFLSRMRSLRRKEISAGILEEALCLPEDLIQDNITGVSVHPSASQVYFSAGLHIWVKGDKNLTDPSDLVLFHSAPLGVTALSVDWLYRRLFFISDGKVFQCGLENCPDPQEVPLPLPDPPYRIVADPYNGYLFLLLPDGIHRSILPDPSQGQTFVLTPVVSRPALLDLAVSFANKRVVFFDQVSRTISATFLDGSDHVTLRPDIGSLRSVQSLAYEKDLFVLTNGRVVYQEVKQGNVFNEFLVDCDILEPSQLGFDNVRVSSSSSQPHPVPLSPRTLEVVFGADMASVRWEIPALRMGASPSSWQKWTYSVRISCLNRSEALTQYNLTNTHHTFNGLRGNHGYVVTVWAESPGGSSASVRSEGSTLTLEDHIYSPLVIGVSTVMGIIFIAMIVAVVVWCRRPRQRVLEGITVVLPPDKELEVIRGLVGLANACYAVSPLPIHSYTSTLPLFPRESLKLQRLLGSGAFGEVYEGMIVGQPIQEVIPQNRVAVKTLRKEATESEKAEFLKEAHIMSQFQHPNIVRLLGVCVQNEPQFLILELMPGGDLRSYLMKARPSASRGSLLSADQRLDICWDTCQGCAYLEKMHFVHRDIAARNCLVSVRGYNDSERMVKIGDFGLARDVYKNDYYRKRGEGLLPVRWMSPESLSDGVFNKHTDVWSFGVLLWEITTLGQQPYPALSNLEVMHHINSGKRLSKPADCLPALYDLMLRCWSSVPGERPSFRMLQISLVQLRGSEARLSPAQGPLSPAQDPLSPAQAPLSPAQDPLSPAQGPLSHAQDPLSPAQDPLSPAQGPLSPAQDPLSPAQGPLSPAQDPLSPAQDPLSPAQYRFAGHVNQAYQEDEADCITVDEDEGTRLGLTHVVSEEGLNYLMFRVDGPGEETDGTKPC